MNEYRDWLIKWAKGKGLYNSVLNNKVWIYFDDIGETKNCLFVDLNIDSEGMMYFQFSIDNELYTLERLIKFESKRRFINFVIEWTQRIYKI